MTGPDIILECYLDDIARRIIIILFPGHVTRCVTVSAGIIFIIVIIILLVSLLFFYYFVTRHRLRDGVMFGPVVISD